MEAVVLLGLVGAGYLFNKQNEDNNPVNKVVNKDISMPSGDNLYSSDFYNETDKMIRNLANTNFAGFQAHPRGVRKSYNFHDSTDHEHPSFSFVHLFVDLFYLFLRQK